MEDELKKQNTDCVYFLASPLTCKKGSECEYRHSENARLNPRDCWYWLSGNCLNPACSFRHPPLDGRPETSSESVHLPTHSYVAASKTNVPCYFFFNSYCIKGDNCPFLHGPNSISSSWKPTKTASMGPDTNISENKTSTESNTRPGSLEAPANPSQTTSGDVNVQFQPKGVRLEASNTLVNRCPSTQPICIEAAVKLSDTPPPVADFIDCNRRPLVSQDQNSVEEHIDKCVESEEPWESSPGLDVIVDGGSDHLGYEDDAEYLAVHDRETGRLHNNLIQYDYEDPIGYDPMDYPDTGILHEHGLYDSYSHLDNDYHPDYVRRVPDHLRGRMLKPMMLQKRLLPRELEVNYQNGVDLRDCLINHKRDGRHWSHGSRKRRSTCVSDNSGEQHVRHRVGYELHGRLASEVGKNTIRPQRDSESGSRGSNRPRRLRHSHTKHNRRGQREERRKKKARIPSVSSEISGGLTVNDKKSMMESTGFTGPKTLAQIKEEKSRACAGDDDSRNMSSPALGRPNIFTSEKRRALSPLS